LYLRASLRRRSPRPPPRAQLHDDATALASSAASSRSSPAAAAAASPPPRRRRCSESPPKSRRRVRDMLSRLEARAPSPPLNGKHSVEVRGGGSPLTKRRMAARAAAGLRLTPLRLLRGGYDSASGGDEEGGRRAYKGSEQREAEEREAREAHRRAVVVPQYGSMKARFGVDVGMPFKALPTAAR
jgi:hypothetical protein